MSNSNFVALSDGRFLFNDHGKYRPNLTFILAEIPRCKEEYNNGAEGIQYLDWGETHANAFNLEGRNMKSLEGDFWVSAKGTNCFAPKKGGKHILVSEDWGGGGDRGDLSQIEGMVYFHRASSNGGGTGNTYAIFPQGFKVAVSVDDI